MMLQKKVRGETFVDSALRDEDMGRYITLMKERASDPRYQHRMVHVVARFTPQEAWFEIEDEGPGFDTTIDPAMTTTLESTSGRGLMSPWLAI